MSLVALLFISEHHQHAKCPHQYLQNLPKNPPHFLNRPLEWPRPPQLVSLHMCLRLYGSPGACLLRLWGPRKGYPPHLSGSYLRRFPLPLRGNRGAPRSPQWDHPSRRCRPLPHPWDRCRHLRYALYPDWPHQHPPQCGNHPPGSPPPPLPQGHYRGRPPPRLDLSPGWVHHPLLHQLYQSK